MEEKNYEKRVPWILAGLFGLTVVVCCFFIFSKKTDVFQGHLGRSVNVRMATIQNYKESQEDKSVSTQDVIVIDTPKESEMPKEWFYVKPVLIEVILDISHPYLLIIK